MTVRRFMVDIEGLGNMPGGVILSIGWCRFNLEGPVLEQSGEVRLEIQPQLDAGMHVSSGPIEFWLAQTASPWAPDTLVQQPVEALVEFNAALRGASEVWAKPPQYDLAGIQAAFKIFKIAQSWPFRNERCFRTLKRMAPSDSHLEPLPEGEKHGALADAIHQAREAAGMLKAMS